MSASQELVDIQGFNADIQKSNNHLRKQIAAFEVALSQVQSRKEAWRPDAEKVQRLQRKLRSVKKQIKTCKTKLNIYETANKRTQRQLEKQSGNSGFAMIEKRIEEKQLEFVRLKFEVKKLNGMVFLNGKRIRQMEKLRTEFPTRVATCMKDRKLYKGKINKMLLQHATNTEQAMKQQSTTEQLQARVEELISDLQKLRPGATIESLKAEEKASRRGRKRDWEDQTRDLQVALEKKQVELDNQTGEQKAVLKGLEKELVLANKKADEDKESLKLTKVEIRKSELAIKKIQRETQAMERQAREAKAANAELSLQVQQLYNEAAALVKAADEKAAAAKAKKEKARLATEKKQREEAERAATEKAEEERLAAEKAAEEERIAAEKAAEEERIAAEKAEAFLKEAAAKKKAEEEEKARLEALEKEDPMEAAMAKVAAGDHSWGDVADEAEKEKTAEEEEDEGAPRLNTAGSKKSVLNALGLPAEAEAEGGGGGDAAEGDGSSGPRGMISSEFGVKDGVSAVQGSLGLGSK